MFAVLFKVVAKLHSARVKHHAAWSADCGGWQVGCELGTDNAACSMRACNLPPDGTHESVILFCLGTVHVEHLLAEVEICGCSVVDALDLEQVGVSRLRAKCTGAQQHSNLIRGQNMRSRVTVAPGGFCAGYSTL